jgi:hypothetical protein
LKKIKELTIKATNKYSLITICNYDNYNTKKINTNKQEHKQNTPQLTNEQHTNGKQLTTNNNDNNDNNINNENNLKKVTGPFFADVMTIYFYNQNKCKDIVIKNKNTYKADSLNFCQKLLDAGYNIETITTDFNLIFDNIEKLSPFLRQKTFNIYTFGQYYSEICDCIKIKLRKNVKNNFDKATYIKNTFGKYY